MVPIRRRRRAVKLFTLLALAGATVVTAEASPSEPMRLDARVRCLETIERVYWKHRTSDPHATFARALPQQMLQRRAEDLGLKMAALRELWQIDVSPQRVQAELDRMAAHSQSPARLRELFAALGDDPTLAAECLARPVLVDRLLRAEYDRDERLAGARPDAATQELDGGERRSFETWWHETRGQLTTETEGRSFAYRLPVVSGTACVDDSWRPTKQLLDPRYWHTAVWTGSEMIVFGGMSNVGTTYADGSRYDPATDTWQLLPTAGSPGARQSHVAVWTGTEMVVWGGRADASGGRYNPATNSWAPTALANAPQPRANPSVVWTGSEMLVWGGEGQTGLLNSGGRYDPSSNTWTAMTIAPLTPRAYHSAVWTGTEMIIWNGYNVHLGSSMATARATTR
jgi:hypothetical protein